MNYLEILQEINRLAGTQGTVDAVSGLTGYQELLPVYADNAYEDIQLFRDCDWIFMRQEAEKALDATTNSFTDTDIAKIRFITYDYKKLTYVPYERWILWENMSTGEPKMYTIQPETGEVTLNPLNAAYTVKVYYQRVPDTMTAQTDEPILPTRFQNLIVFKALIDLGQYVGNYDLTQHYGTRFSVLMGQMLRSQNPAKKLKTKPFVRGEFY